MEDFHEVDETRARQRKGVAETSTAPSGKLIKRRDAVGKISS